MKQCKFYDVEAEAFLGGILTDDDEIICGCCGGIIPRNVICMPEEKPQEEHEIIVKKIYDNWVDLSEEIMGSDYL